jgi:hypothetical protein
VHLAVDVDLGGSATVPGSEQHTTAAASVLDVLERVHEIRNASQAGEAAEAESPCVGAVANLIGDSRHGALATSRAVGRSRATVQARNWGGAVELGTGLGWLLGSGRLDSILLLLRLLGLLIHLLLRWGRLAVGLLLLLVVDLLVRVLVDGRLLVAGHIRRLRVLVHGDSSVLLLHCGGGVEVECLVAKKERGVFLLLEREGM